MSGFAGQRWQAGPTWPVPGLAGALGAIALYFMLQVGVGSGLYALLSARELLAEADRRALTVVLTVPVAGGLSLWAVHRTWPLAWRTAAVPGLGLARGARPVDYGLALVIGLSWPLLGGWLTQLRAGDRQIHQHVREMGAAAGIGLRVPLALLAVTLAPMVEEVLFRGVLLSALARRWTGPVAVLGSALLFAFAHLPDLDFNFLAMPELLVLGLALAWLRLRSGSLWPAILAHGLHNLPAALAWFAAPLAG